MIFVNFYSPGTFMAEVDSVRFDERNLKEIYNYSKRIHQRHGATPYAFSIVGTPGTYFLNCKIETLEEIKFKKDPNDRHLIWNMEINRWNKVATSTKGWKWTQPFKQQDFNIIEVNNEIQIKSYFDYN